MKKERQISEVPDMWVILKIGDSYKVFATWPGGYLGEDRWRLNSGISKAEQDDNYYYFYGFSGSCYKCYKKAYGVVTMFGKGTLAKILLEKEVILLEDRDDWVKFFY